MNWLWPVQVGPSWWKRWRLGRARAVPTRELKAALVRPGWMESHVRLGDAGPELHVGCRLCGALLVVPVPADAPLDVVVRQTIAFTHRETCAVPRRLEMARNAYRN